MKEEAETRALENLFPEERKLNWQLNPISRLLIRKTEQMKAFVTGKKEKAEESVATFRAARKAKAVKRAEKRVARREKLEEYAYSKKVKFARGIIFGREKVGGLKESLNDLNVRRKTWVENKKTSVSDSVEEKKEQTMNLYEHIMEMLRDKKMKFDAWTEEATEDVSEKVVARRQAAVGALDRWKNEFEEMVQLQREVIQEKYAEAEKQYKNHVYHYEEKVKPTLIDIFEGKGDLSKNLARLREPVKDIVEEGPIVDRESIFFRFPVARGMVTYGIVYPISSLMQQYAASGLANISIVECIEMGILGSCWVAPTMYYWYQFVDWLFPDEDALSLLKKAILEQTIFSPFSIVTFFYGMGYIQGQTVKEINYEIEQKFWPTYKVGWIYWPMINVIDFMANRRKDSLPVIAQLIPLIPPMAAFWWGFYLSTMKKAEVPICPRREEDELEVISRLMQRL